MCSMPHTQVQKVLIVVECGSGIGCAIKFASPSKSACVSSIANASSIASARKIAHTSKSTVQ